MLHDVCHLILCAKLPDHAREAIKRSTQTQRPLHEVQHEMLNYHYGDIGAMLLASWNLPEELQSLIRYHPNPMAAPTQRLETALLHLAHEYSGQNTAATPVDAGQLVDPQVRARIDLSQDEINQSIETARQISVEIGKGILA